MSKNEDMTIKEAQELISRAGDLQEIFGGAPKPKATPTGSHSFREGQAIFMRCVTHYYTGRVVKVTDSDVVLEDAAWIADGMRFHNMLKEGLTKEAEIEPFPDGAVVSRGAIVDWCVWGHELPTKEQ
jgi:hypothetical protein